MSESPIRIAIVGGGCAGLTAAFELTRPELERRYDITVFQMGWRLGGKGASGRGPSGRIEEHGLHLWMGYYENAFRLMRECYAELARDPSCPIAAWTDAFEPANFNTAADWSPSGRWLAWKVHFPSEPGLPGDADPRLWTVPEYMARAAALVRTLFQAIRTQAPSAPASSERSWFAELLDGELGPEALSEAVTRVIKQGVLVGLGAASEALRLLESLLRSATEYPQSTLLALVEAVDRAVRRELERLVAVDDELRRLWEIADIALAVIRGSIRFRLAFDPRGFDAIDAYDSREWLKLNGASDRAINSAFIRGLYDLAFAYEGGRADRPSFSAGAALRGAMRAFFTYRGAFFWKMSAGMGDVVFAPLYEVLKRRGVRFEFFHRLQALRLGDADETGRRHVSALEFHVQAKLRAAGEYAPLFDVRGLPCWPSAPDLAQLENAPHLTDPAWDPESQWDKHHVGTRTLRVGDDFDLVVLAIGLGAVPDVCGELLESDERWREMVARVGTVPTQAFQLWLKPSMKELGWNDEATNLSAFVEPFDTWADMTHVAKMEGWERRPGAIAYFCNVLPDEEPGDLPKESFVEHARSRVGENAVRFLNREVRHLWPNACHVPGRFRWEELLAPEETSAEKDGDGEGRLRTQYVTANVRPSDRYSQALPGSAPYRISPLDPNYDNLVAAGDWTNTGLNMGCVEAAVMSGRLASHAISKSPPLSDIIGFDHP